MLTPTPLTPLRHNPPDQQKHHPGVKAYRYALTAESLTGIPGQTAYGVKALTAYHQEGTAP